MDPERWVRVEKLMREALDLPVDQRRSFLDRHCTGDSRLLSDVESLLAAESQAGGFLDVPAAEYAASLMGDVRAAEPEPEDAYVGRRVGSYRILRRIGLGGMGAVYLAERADGAFEQQVALKVVKRGLDTEEVLQRFVQERRILARLQHPNIARLVDGGVTEDGLPYFAMEYVAGKPLTAHAEERSLGVPARLLLFQEVCRAVEYAHRNLVIHRDLKPGNVLVSDAGEVKLLDFGIAKLLEPEDQGILTRTKGRMMTPSYASPEQVRGEAVTTATDVYGLGIVLYELLCGRLPFVRPDQGAGELERAILEEPPTPPSAAAHKPAPKDAAEAPTETVASGRASPGLSRKVPDPRLRIPRDLDNIVLMALRKEPERRYPSVEAFREDVRRYLEGLPLTARKATWGYRTTKFVGRHRLAVTAGAVVFVALVAGLAGTAWQARVASRERDRARLEAQKALKIKNFMTGVFLITDPSQAKGESVTARELLDRGAERAEKDLAEEPEVQAELLGLMGELYKDLGLFDRSESLLKRSLSIEQRIHPQDDLDVAMAFFQWGRILWEKGRYPEALKAHQEALRIRQRLLKPGDPAIGDSLGGLAAVYDNQGNYAEAEKLNRLALAMDRAHRGTESPEVAYDLSNIGNILNQQRKFKEAEPLLREALAIRLKVLGDSHPDVALARATLAMNLEGGGKYEEAKSQFEQAIALDRKCVGNDSPTLAEHLDNYGQFLANKGELSQAREATREAVEIRRRTIGESHPNFAVSMANLGVLSYRLHDYPEAERYFRESLRISRPQLGEEHPSVITTINNLGMTLIERGNLEQAEALLRKALELRRKVFGEESQDTAQGLRNLGGLFIDRGDLDQAATFLEPALEMARKVYPEGHPQIAAVLVVKSRWLMARGEPGKAEPLLREAEKIRREKIGESTYQTAEARMFLGASLGATGRCAEGGPLLQQALATFEKEFGSSSIPAAQARMLMASCPAFLGGAARAHAAVAESYRIFHAQLGDNHRLTQEARRISKAMKTR